MGFVQRASLLFGGYSKRVLATNPLAYWQNNQGSGTAIPDSSGNGYNGTGWTGIDWRTASPPPMGGAYVELDGVNDYGNLLSAGLSSAFDYDEGCILLWAKVANAGVWTDGTARHFISFFRDADNFIRIFRTAANNTLQLYYESGATIKTETVGSLSYTGWFTLMLSWTTGGDQMKSFINGVQVGTTQTGLVASTGSGVSVAWYGAQNGTPLNGWNGNLSQAIIWNNPVTSDILALGVA